MFVASQAITDPFILNLLPILQQACTILKNEYEQYRSGQSFQIHEKSDDSPVTQADLRVNRFLVDSLLYLTPELPVLSEESDYSKRHQWTQCWMLDPLDGTKEFIHQRDEFTINLSLLEGSQTIFSIIAVPMQDLIYLGYHDQLPIKYHFHSQQWWVYQREENVLQKKIQVGLSHNSKNKKYQDFIEPLQHNHEVIRKEAGSAYKFCLMLEGQIDIYPRFHPTSEWDTSAGQSLLESIGGGLVSLKGDPFVYNQRETILNDGFIAFRNHALKIKAFDALGQAGIIH